MPPVKRKPVLISLVFSSLAFSPTARVIAVFARVQLWLGWLRLSLSSFIPAASGIVIGTVLWLNT